MRQHRSPARRRARALAIVPVIAAALALSGCSAIGSLVDGIAPKPAETRDESGTIVEGGQTDVFAIAVGDCLDDQSGDVVQEVPTVPCSEPHAYEVYAEIVVTDADEYPGTEAIETEADAGCYDAFGPFVGFAYEDSELDFNYYYPTAESWAEGDRIVSCLILEVSGADVTGSLAGAGR